MARVILLDMRGWLWLVLWLAIGPAGLAQGGSGEYLYWLLDAGRLQEVEWRIQKGGVWGLRDFRGAWANRMVSLAAARGHNRLLLFMLNQGSDVDAPGELGLTPLTAAAIGGNLETMQLLLSRGAKVNLPSKNGATPLIMAAQFGNGAAIRLLLNKGANPKQFSYGTTPLIEVVKANRPELVRLLLAQGVGIDQADSADGYTALMWAAQLGFGEVVKALLKHKPNLHLRNLQGQTALGLAVQQHNPEVAQLLRQAGSR